MAKYAFSPHRFTLTDGVGPIQEYLDGLPEHVKYEQRVLEIKTGETLFFLPDMKRRQPIQSVAARRIILEMTVNHDRAPLTREEFRRNLYPALNLVSQPRLCPAFVLLCQIRAFWLAQEWARESQIGPNCFTGAKPKGGNYAAASKRKLSELRALGIIIPVQKPSSEAETVDSRHERSETTLVEVEPELLSPRRPPQDILYQELIAGMPEG